MAEPGYLGWRATFSARAKRSEAHIWIYYAGELEFSKDWDVGYDRIDKSGGVDCKGGWWEVVASVTSISSGLDAIDRKKFLVPGCPTDASPVITEYPENYFGPDPYNPNGLWVGYDQLR
jgi:hypothetical protein